MRSSISTRTPLTGFAVTSSRNFISSMSRCVVKRYFRSNLAKIVFIEIKANRRPRQFLGPFENAMNANGFRFELTSLSKWSGLNSSASNPQISLRRWAVNTESTTSVPFGMTQFLSWVSSVQWRSKIGPTGNTLSVSFITCSK